MRRITFFAFVTLWMLWGGCKQQPAEQKPDAASPLSTLRHYYKNSKYDTAYLYFKPALESLQKAGQWDTIYTCSEMFTIILNYQQKFAEGYSFLQTLEKHYLESTPVDSGKIASIRVRRSDLLKETGNFAAAIDTNLAALKVRQRLYPYPHSLKPIPTVMITSICRMRSVATFGIRSSMGNWVFNLSKTSDKINP